MKLTNVNLIRKEDLGKGADLPKWIDALLGPLNQILDNMARALKGRLTFADNFACIVSQQVFDTGAALEIGIPIGKRVLGCFPVESLNKQIDKFGFSRLQTGNINVTIDFVGGGTAIPCTLIVLFAE